MTDADDIFGQINNAVLDLQSATLQSYSRPLKRLGRLLQDPVLTEINDEIISGLDVEAFIEEGSKTQGSMVGSASLPWPEDDLKIIGLQLLLIQKFCDDPEFMATFGHHFYYSGSKVLGAVNAVTSQVIMPFARDYKTHVLSQGKTDMRIVDTNSKKVFIVHGHDGEARETVARFLSKIGFEPIILNEQANRGRTIIEKIEDNADVGFAVILLTPDDIGKAKKGADFESRARQNVLLELGYFMARLGRERVCSLKKGDVTVPSDFAGIVWEEMDSSGGWKQALGRELEAAGHSVDWNAVMR